MAAYSASAADIDGNTETLSSTAYTLSALVKSGLSTFVGATAATVDGIPMQPAIFEDQGVTFVGADGVSPEVHPAGRSVSWSSAVAPRAAVWGRRPRTWRRPGGRPAWAGPLPRRRARRRG